MKYWIVALLTIIASSAFAQTEISGEVSGVWTADDSPYIVVDSTWVAEGDTLTIEAGVDVLFGDSLGLDVYGVLQAFGEEDDSVRFIPNGEETSWEGIGLYGQRMYNTFRYFALYGADSGYKLTTQIGLIVEHSNIHAINKPINIPFRPEGDGCDLRFSHSSLSGNRGIHINSSFTANNCIISAGSGNEHEPWGIICITGSIDLDDCVVYGVIELGWFASSNYTNCRFLYPPNVDSRCSVWLQGDNARMVDCFVDGNASIKFGSNVLVSNTYIAGMVECELVDVSLQDSEIGVGIDCRQSSVNVENCIISGSVSADGCPVLSLRDCNIGLGAGATSGQYFSAVNCQINEIGIMETPAFVKGCIIGRLYVRNPYDVQIINNTIYADSLPDFQLPLIDFRLSNDETQNCELRNNIIYIASPFTWCFGVNDVYRFRDRVSLRYNCIYGFERITSRIPYELDSTNIVVSPLLADPFSDNFNLAEDSPCIDAGDPNSPFDPDSTRADIGAYYYPHEPERVGRNNTSQILDLVSMYPNPFNDSFSVQFVLKEPSPVSIDVFDVAGRMVYNSTDIVFNRGVHAQMIKADFPSGQYFVSVQIDGEAVTIPINRLK